MNGEKRQLKGKVHSFGGGYGYIIGDNDRAYHVHEADIDDETLEPDQRAWLQEGDLVEFDVCTERTGNVATHVRKIK